MPMTAHQHSICLNSHLSMLASNRAFSRVVSIFLVTVYNTQIFALRLKKLGIISLALAFAIMPNSAFSSSERSSLFSNSNSNSSKSKNLNSLSNLNNLNNLNNPHNLNNPPLEKHNSYQDFLKNIPQMSLLNKSVQQVNESQKSLIYASEYEKDSYYSNQSEQQTTVLAREMTKYIWKSWAKNLEEKFKEKWLVFTIDPNDFDQNEVEDIKPNADGLNNYDSTVSFDERQYSLLLRKKSSASHSQTENTNSSSAKLRSFSNAISKSSSESDRGVWKIRPKVRELGIQLNYEKPNARMEILAAAKQKTISLYRSISSLSLETNFQYDMILKNSSIGLSRRVFVPELSISYTQNQKGLGFLGHATKTVGLNFSKQF